MKYLIITAVILHVLTRTFWDYGVDYSFRDRFYRALKTGDIQEIRLAYRGVEREETPAYNRYSLGFSIVMFLWVIARQSKKQLSEGMIIFLEWWSFWVISDVVKELANYFNILTWLFNNPTEKYLSEYVIFFLSGGWIWWRFRKLKHSA